MAGVVDHVKPACRPPLRQQPGGLQWAAYVVAAVDEHARDAVEVGCVVEQLVVLQEGRVAPLVRDQTCESEAKVGIFVARVRPVPRNERDMRVFPRAPFLRRVLTDGGISVEEQRRIRIDERQLPQGVWYRRGESVPL